MDIKQVFFLLPRTEKVEWRTEICISIPPSLVLMVIVSQTTHTMEMNVVTTSFLRPTMETGGSSPRLSTVCSGCDLTTFRSLTAWMVWVSALGTEGSAYGPGSHGLGSGVSVGNLHHANQPPDEFLTSSCKHRINKMPDLHSNECVTLTSLRSTQKL